MKATYHIQNIHGGRERVITVTGIKYDQAMDYMALVSKGISINEFVRSMECSDEVVGES